MHLPLFSCTRYSGWLNIINLKRTLIIAPSKRTQVQPLIGGCSAGAIVPPEMGLMYHIAVQYSLLSVWEGVFFLETFPK